MDTNRTEGPTGSNDDSWSNAGAAADKVNTVLREAGMKAAELAQNPIARSMLAAGLVAAAAALTQSGKARKVVADASRDAIDNAEAAADSASKFGAAIVTAATDAVRRVLAAGGVGESESASGAKAAPAKKGGRGASSVKPTSGKRAASGAKPAKSSSGKATSGKSASSAAAKPAKATAKSSSAKPATTKKVGSAKPKASTGGAGSGVG